MREVQFKLVELQKSRRLSAPQQSKMTHHEAELGGTFDHSAMLKIATTQDPADLQELRRFEIDRPL